MKKKKFLLTIPALCLAILFCGTTALASNPDDVKYCSTCAAPLNWVAGSSGNRTDVHYLPTNLVDSDKRPIYEKCTITYVETPVAKVCSKGHGVKWSATCYDEYHTSDKCVRHKREYR